ncbi:MAG: S8 family serine peptidase, partial [candidate division Zixibacteria bacterium]|nr:S8 family serine peptidase [candidate division Zixibacteria bacterium]
MSHRIRVNTRSAVTCLLVILLAPSFGWTRTADGLEPGYKPLRPVLKPAAVRISPLAPSGRLVVKFKRGAPVDSKSDRLGGSVGRQAESIIGRYGMAQLRPLLSDDREMITSRRLAAEDRSGVNLPDMSLYFQTPVISHQAAERAIRALNALDDVEIAYFSPQPENAEWTGELSVPNYEPGQRYLEEAPGGVDSRAAWSLPGGRGEGVTIIDVENGWNLDHEDLSVGASTIVVGGGGVALGDHGTAVLGEMFADPDLMGMTGMVYNSGCGVSPVNITVAAAISDAIPYLEPGDIILIEQHAPGPRYGYEWRDDQLGYMPMEFFQAEFDAMLNAYAAGIIVCEAAGNGEEDLDDTLYTPLFDTSFRHSHAIMCGAGNPPVGGVAQDRSKLDFSNWGERVNLQGYGVRVYTLGYGDLYDGGSEDSWYTDSFSGTSSASPIVTGAVASLSGIFQNMFGTLLDADSALVLLESTGSPQTNPNLIYHIGPRPNLHAALDPLFDPVDSVWYGDIGLCKDGSSAMPIYLTNSHPVREIYLPFRLTGDPFIAIDSLTRAERTNDFAQITVTFDNRFNGEVAYVMRAYTSGHQSPLWAGSGPIAYLWFRTNALAELGQEIVVDSAWLGSTNRLRLTSEFDDGYPDYFSAGTITIAEECEYPILCQGDCPNQADLFLDGTINAVDLNIMIETLFFSRPEEQDPGCDVTRSDFDADGFSDALDLNMMITMMFFNGPPPSN